MKRQYKVSRQPKGGIDYFLTEEIVPEVKGWMQAKEEHKEKKNILSRWKYLRSMLMPLLVLILGSNSQHLGYEFNFMNGKRFKDFLSSSSYFNCLWWYLSPGSKFQVCLFRGWEVDQETKRVRERRRKEREKERRYLCLCQPPIINVIIMETANRY